MKISALLLDPQRELPDKIISEISVGNEITSNVITEKTSLITLEVKTGMGCLRKDKRGKTAQSTMESIV